MTAIHIIESGDAKSFGDLTKDIMQQEKLGQDLYPKNSAVNFELMVKRSKQYQSLGQRQEQKSGRGGHNG